MHIPTKIPTDNLIIPKETSTLIRPIHRALPRIVHIISTIVQRFNILLHIPSNVSIHIVIHVQPQSTPKNEHAYPTRSTSKNSFENGNKIGEYKPSRKCKERTQSHIFFVALTQKSADAKSGKVWTLSSWSTTFVYGSASTYSGNEDW